MRKNMWYDFKTGELHTVLCTETFWVTGFGGRLGQTKKKALTMGLETVMTRKTLRAEMIRTQLADDPWANRSEWPLELSL